jgi:hypothetical protein
MKLKHICYITPDDIVIENQRNYYMITEFKVTSIRVMSVNPESPMFYFRYLLDNNEVHWFLVKYEIRSGIYYTKFKELDKVDDYWIRNLYKELDREDKLKQLGI